MDFADGIPSVIGQRVGYGEGKPINRSNHTVVYCKDGKIISLLKSFFMPKSMLPDFNPR